MPILVLGRTNVPIQSHGAGLDMCALLQTLLNKCPTPINVRSALDFEALATRELVRLHLHEGRLGPLPLPILFDAFFWWTTESWTTFGNLSL